MSANEAGRVPVLDPASRVYGKSNATGAREQKKQSHLSGQVTECIGKFDECLWQIAANTGVCSTASLERPLRLIGSRPERVVGNDFLASFVIAVPTSPIAQLCGTWCSPAREVAMRWVFACAFVVALAGPGAARHLAALGIAGDAAELRQVISGNTCTNSDGDVLTFGKSQAGSSGTFEHTGRPAGSYAIGYATLLVKRGDGLHSHAIVVLPETSTLHFSGIAYRCRPTRAE